MKKKNLVLTYSNNQTELTSLTYPFLERYCEHHNLDLLIMRESTQKIIDKFDADDATWFPSCDRWYAHDLFQLYDRILWIGSDVLVQPYAPNIFDVVPEGQIGVFIDQPKDGGHHAGDLMGDCFNAFGVRPDGYYNIDVMLVDNTEKEIFNYNDLDMKLINKGKWNEQDYFNYYTKVNNEASFFKYLGLGKEVYPKEVWDDYEVDFIDTNYDLAKKTSLYDTEDAAGKLTDKKYLQFGDLFVNVKNKEKDLDSATQVKYTLKAADAFKKAFQLNNANAAAIFNVGVIYYNIFGEYDDQVSANIRALRAISTANEEEFAAKKAAAKTPQAKAAVNKASADKLAAAQAPLKQLNASIDVEVQKNIDISIDALEKAYLALKDKTDRSKRDNNLLNNCARYLTNLYEVKRNKFRGKDPQKFDMYEAKYKEFDALQNSFGN